MDHAHTGLEDCPQSIRHHLRGRQGSPMIYRLHKINYRADSAAPDSVIRSANSEPSQAVTPACREANHFHWAKASFTSLILP
jgi:hypothetical protein